VPSIEFIDEKGRTHQYCWKNDVPLHGHGKRYLSYNMYLLTLLAFYFHQIFELTDGAYQTCRAKAGSKQYLWEVFRGTIQFLVIDSWEEMMDLYLNPDDYEVTKTKKV
jgi:hypothetical protein